jgi:hypothetical protein
VGEVVFERELKRVLVEGGRLVNAPLVFTDEADHVERLDNRPPLLQRIGDHERRVGRLQRLGLVAVEEELVR